MKTKIKIFDKKKGIDSGMHKMTLKFSKPMTKKQVIEFYENELELNCACSHDCCGHWFSRLGKVTQKSRSKFELNIGYAKNY